MTNQLSAILSACAGPVAIFTDFDGTLVEIAPRPDAIDVPESLAGRLGALQSSLDGAFAIISGRTIANIDGFLSSPTFSISGSHGAEQRHLGRQSPASAEHAESAARISRTLSEQFDGDDRILVEPKPSGVAVHYRAAPERGPDVRRAMDRALERTPDFQAIDGKKVIEARPRGTDKGAAIAALMEQAPFSGRTPLFIGDDVTDEDGFRTVNAMGGITVKVGPGDSEARFRLPDVPSVLDLLDRLADGGQPKEASK